MKKRIVALLLCCVMLLTLSPSLIASASADDEPGTAVTESTEPKNEEPAAKKDESVPASDTGDAAKDETKDEVKDEAKEEQKPADEPKNEEPAFDVKAAYDALMACTTVEDMIALSNKLTDEQIAMFSDEQIAALNAKYDTLMPEAPEDLGSVVPFLNVAPLVSGTTSVRRTARNVAAQADDSEGKKAVELKKTATANSDGTYTITLEAFATGESTSQTFTEPVDIVLVLDVSGSMDDPLSTYSEIYSRSLDNNGTYYVKIDGKYTQVSSYYDYWNKTYEWGYYTGSGIGGRWVSVTPKTDANDTNAAHTQFYEVKSGEKKIEALKSAVTSFIENVAAKSADSQIAIVKFAGNKTDRVGNDTYRDSGYTYNYTQIVRNLKEAGTGVDDLKEAINGLKPAGATQANYGMQHAQTIITNAANDGKKKVVIMFTDGEPTSKSKFENSVANAAITASKGIKDAGATVYTIGVFSDADGTPVTDINSAIDVNKYMHLVSSNYKNATNMSNPGAATYPDGGKSYYLSAGSAGELSSIFQQISQEVGGTESKLDENSVIKDIIAPSFTLPKNTTVDNITLETWSYKGSSYDAANAWTKNTDTMGAMASIDDGQVNVTGFNFKENWCGTETKNGNVTYRGNKLVIKFNVTPKTGFLGGNDVYTNDAKSGIYEKPDSNEPFDTFPQPTVNVEIKNVTVGAADKNVYLLGEVTADQLKTGATVKVGNVDLKLNETNFGLQDWQKEYVTINVEIKDAAGKVVTDKITDLRDDTTYTIKVTVSPNTKEPTSKEGTKAETKSDNNEGNINVFKPVLTFKDSTAYYGETVATDFSGNKVGATLWKHVDTLSTKVTMIGDEPDLTITYTPDGSKIEVGKYTKQDVPVKAEVSINNTDVTSYTTFEHQDCVSDCGWTAPAEKGDPAFLIHVKTCQLTITKTGGTDNEPYVFDVYKDSKKYTEVTIVGNDSVIIYELPIGNYTIAENTAWSWRYTANNGSAANLTTTAPTGTITCTNTRENNYWLNGFSTVVTNIFDKKN